MGRPVTMMTLTFCCIFMLIALDAKALDMANTEPENCYLVAVSHNSLDDLGSDAKPAPQSVHFIGAYLARFDLQALPIPASLLFVAVWLIGFKMTRQPSAALSRVEPSRYSKSYMEMSVSKNTESTSC